MAKNKSSNKVTLDQVIDETPAQEAPVMEAPIEEAVVAPIDPATGEEISEPVVDESPVEEVSKSAEKRVKVMKEEKGEEGKGHISLADLSDEDRKALRLETMQDIVQDQGAVKIIFHRTSVAGSAETAQRLNDSKYVIAMWELDEGEKVGYIEEVKINGAVARVPKGKTLYIPEKAAKLFKNYKMAEQNPDRDITNKQGTVGLKIDRNPDDAKYFTK